jgi:hypothetical protein
MWGPNDYWGEMDRLTSEQIEVTLSGHEAPGDEPGAARLAEIVRDLREGLLAEVPAAMAAGHLEAMAAARRSEPAEVTPERRNDVRAMTRKRVTLLGLAAALIIGGGLMAAAVTLPDRASETAQQVLGDLPIPGPTGTPGDPSSNDHGQAVSELARDDSLQGCEKGMAVSDLASSKADEFRQDPGRPGDPVPGVVTTERRPRPVAPAAAEAPVVRAEGARAAAGPSRVRAAEAPVVRAAARAAAGPSRVPAAAEAPVVRAEGARAAAGPSRVPAAGVSRRTCPRPTRSRAAAEPTPDR